MVVTSLYVLAFSRFLSWLLPGYEPNVNAAFVDSTWKLMLPAALTVYLFSFVTAMIRKTDRIVFENRARNVTIADSALILLPLTPVVQYVLNNQDILSTAGSWTVVGVFAAFSILFVLVIPTLFSLVGSGRTLAVIGMAFAFTITNMASLTAHSKWYERGELKVQLGLFLAILVGGLLLYNFVGRKFTRAVVALYLVANSVSVLSSNHTGDAGLVPAAIDNKMVELTGTRTPLTTPSIYFLVYDAYVANETMLAHGIDNSAQEDYLVEAGFRIYPETYSVTAASVSTIHRVFNVTREYCGEPRSAPAGNGVVQRLLQSFGYETFGLFWDDYFFQSGGSYYDDSFPDLTNPQWILVKSIFMGEFRFDNEFDSPSRAEFEQNKVTVFAKTDGPPKFVYMHDDFPGHSQNSGVCLPDEVERFAERLKIANEEMKKNLELIMRSDPDAIVIVAGDHGPFLTKNCTSTWKEYDISEITRLDVQDRYGTFLAIRWPDEGPADFDDIVVLQDLFPAVFSFLFGDTDFLSARIEPLTISAGVTTSGVEVSNGIIASGPLTGERLYVTP